MSLVPNVGIAATSKVVASNICDIAAIQIT
jgi:hypothetical protein